MPNSKNTDATDARIDIEVPDKTIKLTTDDHDEQSAVYYFEHLFAGAYPVGTVLEYHEFELRHTINNVWTVRHEDDPTPIDILNLAGFQSATELHAYLDDLAALNPDTRNEWRAHRTGGVTK